KKLNKRQRLIRKKVKIIKEKLKKNKPDVTNDKKPKLTETTSLENGVSKTKASQKQQKGKQLNEEKASKKSKKDLQTNGDFKPVYEIKTAEDVSANWKQLKEIITKDDKKRKRKPECSKNKASDKPDSEALHDETPKEKEVWFDDVDPILLEDEKSIKKVLKEQTNGVKSSGIKTYDESNPATFKKKNSFSGLTKVVALDCEMVGGGINGEEDLLARISIVNHFGNTIYDKYVKPNGEVHDYRTFVSGIRPSDLEKAEPFDKVQKEVSDLLDGKIVVGHALSNDFRCLMLSHPRHMIRDSSKYRPFIS
ncbi:UNVERIFIED_CONTAM: hypothetical protein GTU68_066670, partial [Idotea baltica]|nr:hypothetical protein [Idotea baltica]